MDITVTNADTDAAAKFALAFRMNNSNMGGLKPSQISSPVQMAFLRTTSSGFPLSTPDRIIMVKGDEADMLRSIYARFSEGKTTDKQFANSALPLLLKLYLWAT